MAQRVLYPDHIEPLVQFVEETTPEHIVARAHDKLAAGTSVKDMLLASALAVVRSSDLPPGHHGGPLHPLAGLHAVRHIAARLPGEYAMLPVIQNVAVANKHIHSPAMGPFILADAQPVSDRDSLEGTLAAFRDAASRGVYNACDHYFLYLVERLSPMQMLDHVLGVAIAKNQLDDHYFLFPVFTWRALEYLGWEYARYIGRAPVRYVTRPTADASLEEVDGLIGKYELLERDLRVETGEDETAAITALAADIGRCSQFGEIPEGLGRALAQGVALEGVGEGLSVGGSILFLRSQTGNPMDVHINTGANARRYLLRQPEQVAPGVRPGVDVHVHRVARLRAQEEDRPAHGQALAHAFQGHSLGQRPPQPLGNLAELAAAADVGGEGGDGRRLVLTGLDAQVALEQFVLADEPIHFFERRVGGGAGDVADRRPPDVPGVLPAEILQRPPGEDRKQEVVVVQLILGNGDPEHVIQHLHRGEPLHQVEEVVIAGVVDPAARRIAERAERPLQAVVFRYRLRVGQDEGPHGRRVDMLVGHGDVLDHGQHGVLAGQARRDVAHGVQPGQRVERAAVVTGRQIRGAHHRQRRGQQHVLHGR